MFVRVHTRPYFEGDKVEDEHGVVDISDDYLRHQAIVVSD